MSDTIRIIEVVSYNSHWKEEYLSEKQKLLAALHDQIVEIHHVGSTAIPDIYAKPVIDILVGVKSISAVDTYNDKMQELGYIAKGEFGIAGRRFFLKGQINRTNHVHIFQVGNLHIARHINFRDYMIAHPDDARRYEKLKQELAEKFRYDIDAYCEGKDAFIKEIDRKAEEWARAK